MREFPISKTAIITLPVMFASGSGMTFRCATDRIQKHFDTWGETTTQRHESLIDYSINELHYNPAGYPRPCGESTAKKISASCPCNSGFLLISLTYH
jgi:hypothetical protein